MAKRNILLVGSVALPDAEAVFATAATLFRGRIKRIPDGETGARLMWVLWARRVLEGHPAFELDPVEAAAGERLTSAVEGSRKWVGGKGERQGAPPPPRLRLKPGVAASSVTLGRIGYVEEALSSYAVFRRLRERGVIEPGVRFQVALPTTAAFLNAHIAYADHAAVEPVFRARLLAEVAEICAAIPQADLSIQWDVSTEMAQWEGVRHAHFAPVEAGVIERLAIHCRAVPPGAELGVHLCYGSYGNRHWKEPDNTDNMVRVHNALAAALARRIDWIHMPVPRNRVDEGFYIPLRRLELRPGGELYLGLVHRTDGVDGTRKRIAQAARYRLEFGIAAECGFGRRPPADIPELLRVHAEA